MQKRKNLLILLLLLLLLLSGCHHPEQEIEEAHPEPWTPSEVENFFGGPDPMEGFNRSMFCCTDFMMNYVAAPLGRVYTTIFPRPFIERLHNVCVNLEYPASLVSTLLQGEWEAAGDDTLRFFINTTLGIGGIFDVADAWWHIPPSEADMGQAFAAWGIGPGHTLVLPLMHTLNGRDLLGHIFDTALDLKTYIPYAGSATALNRIVMFQRQYADAVGSAPDPYKQFRILMLVRRELQLPLTTYRLKKREIAKAAKKLQESAEKAKKEKEKKNPEKLPVPSLAEQKVWYYPMGKPAGITGKWVDLPAYFSQGNMVDTMRTMMAQVQRNHDKMYMRLSWLNSDFAKEGDVRKVELLKDHPPAYYCFWKALKRPDGTPQEKERLVLLLPGIGSDCGAGMAQSLAEAFHLRGCMVATFDSTFNWRFVEADSDGKLPGYLPDDAERMRNMLAAALKDLKDNGLIRDPEIFLFGYSMGGLQTLKIADLEKKSPRLNISRYLAVNPPVATKDAMLKIDELNAVSAGWTKSEMKQRLLSACLVLMGNMQQQFAHFDPASPFADASVFRTEIDVETASCAAGIYLKFSLRDLLFTVHRKRPLPELPPYHWGRRNALYLAIDKLTMDDYARKILAKDYPGRPVTQLFFESSLYSIEETLKTSPKIAVFHNYDDFLITKEQRDWLDRVMGKRLTWFSWGSHLGNLYYTPVLDAFCDAMGLPPADPAVKMEEEEKEMREEVELP